MADYTQNPTALDVEYLLRSTTFWPVGGDDNGQVVFAREQAQITVDAAVAEFEERTGWIPFLADAAPSIQYFDSSNFDGYIDFGGGAVSVESLTVGDTVYALNEQWWPQPANALRRRKPYTGIQTNHIIGRYSKPNRIAVSARWGYCEVWPAAAWLACMRLAAAQTLGQIENAQGLASIGQDGFSKSFDVVGVITQNNLLTELVKKFESIVTVYTRQVC